MAKECIRCGKSLEGLPDSRKFCSPLCRTRYFALKRYHEIKSTPEYKEKRRVYEKKWREENKDAWNEKMKIASRKYREKKKKTKIDTPIDEGRTGQPSGEGTYTPALEGADAGRKAEGDDQPSQFKRNNYEDL